MKKCSRCKTVKNENEFSKNQICCKACYKEYYDNKRPKFCLECGQKCSKKRHIYCSNECRFIHNIEKDERGCWNYLGAHDIGGYVKLRDINEDKKSLMAHRLSYETFKGKIPEGMLVCHACDNRKCVNPKHLWLGTHHDNNMDCKIKGRCSGGQPPGEKHPSAKLNEKQVLEIREKLKNGIRPYILAKEYGVISTTILGIRDGRIWKHI